MSRSARDTTATHQLFQHLTQRSTGELTVGAGELQIAVHLLDGEVIAATAADDAHQLVRMLHLRGVLEAPQADALEERIERGDTVFGDLLEAAGGAVLDGILRDRFQQNLLEYVSSALPPEFTPKRGIFVENIQIGHDSKELVETTCADYDRAMRMDPELQLIRGGVEVSRDPSRSLLVAQLGPSPRTVRSLIQETPLEPIRARLLIQGLIDHGVAEVPLEDQPTIGQDESIAFDPPTRALPPPPFVPAALAAAALPTPAEEAPPLPLHAHPLLDLSDDFDPLEEEDDVEDITDADTDSSDIAHWLGSTDVDQELLDVFDDHDSHRGADGGGMFSTEDHHRDRVEVTTLPSQGLNGEGHDPGESGGFLHPLDSDLIHANGPPPPTPDEISGPAIRYGAPALSEGEARLKLDVANEVLARVVLAFDRAEGIGRGRAVVQLLVDGGPPRYATLLKDLQVTESGWLPDGILHNLYSRPVAEHRQLLHQCLHDMIERALSSAADELPEEHFDDVLASVAGYGQRLGL